MSQIHQLENVFTVRTNTRAYTDTPANFAADYGSPAPALPAGATERIYEPGVRHALLSGYDVVAGGPLPWQVGNDIIANIQVAVAAKEVRAPSTPSDPEDNPIPVISDRQFFQALAIQGLITQGEALAAVRTGTVPAALQALVDGLAPSNQFAANMLLSGAIEFRRNHPLTDMLGVGLGWTSDQLDELWRFAAQL